MKKLLFILSFLFTTYAYGQIPDNAFYFTEQAMHALNMDTIRVILVEIEHDSNLNAFVSVNENLTVFAIYLNKHIDRDIELILAHELVHIQQILDGRMKVFDEYLKWNGRKYYPNQQRHHETPWERDALRNERKIKNMVKN